MMRRIQWVVFEYKVSDFEKKTAGRFGHLPPIKVPNERTNTGFFCPMTTYK